MHSKVFFLKHKNVTFSKSDLYLSFNSFNSFLLVTFINELLNTTLDNITLSILLIESFSKISLTLLLNELLLESTFPTSDLATFHKFKLFFLINLSLQSL